MSALLEVRDLTVDFAGRPAPRAVDGVALSVAARERLAIVGESGSGKSQLLLACTGLLAANGSARGPVRFEGREILGNARSAAAARGRGIGFVFQDASGSLTPHRRIGDQLVEVAMASAGTGRRAAVDAAVEMLGRVRLAEPASLMARYPHELSGGMRQRVAIALMARPRILFADDPTTALDVTVQADILALLAQLCEDLGMALLIVTHDLGIVAALADRVAVMYAGRVVEVGMAAALLSRPRHPYTAGLLAAVPRLGGRGELATIPGAPPAPGEWFRGCRFAPRCPHRAEHCGVDDPVLAGPAARGVACHFPHTGSDTA
ncbi:MAG: ABC transporter ATP-binding protein [Gammaproteobacteria bacterium]|nr:ABC transporter ATP-binding protein [Gammaproteobacteria bacterium]